MPARLERLRFAALMHDIGKLVVPNQLLNKPGRLTPEEFAQVRMHEEVSVQMLSHIDFLRPIAAASHSDHTRFDPDDPDHPIEPYIVMIADAYDAMTSTRAYRKALTPGRRLQRAARQGGHPVPPRMCRGAHPGGRKARREARRRATRATPSSRTPRSPVSGAPGLGDLLENDGVRDLEVVLTGRNAPAKGSGWLRRSLPISPFLPVEGCRVDNVSGWVMRLDPRDSGTR